jgi:hypothetical protein
VPEFGATLNWFFGGVVVGGVIMLIFSLLLMDIHNEKKKSEKLKDRAVLEMHKIEERKRRKLLDTQNNIGNRIHHALWDAIDNIIPSCPCREGFLLETVLENDYSIILKKYSKDPIIWIRVNMFRECPPISVIFYDTNYEQYCSSREKDVGELIQKLEHFVIDYSYSSEKV